MTELVRSDFYGRPIRIPKNRPIIFIKGKLKRWWEYFHCRSETSRIHNKSYTTMIIVPSKFLLELDNESFLLDNLVYEPRKSGRMIYRFS